MSGLGSEQILSTCVEISSVLMKNIALIYTNASSTARTVSTEDEVDE
jgi:hypothetical protein